MNGAAGRYGVVVVVQARTGSTRLPGKVLEPLAGRPMLRFLLDRLAGLDPRVVDRVVVATSDLARDDPVAAVAVEAGVAVVRGPEHDVLARFAAVVDRYPADHVVRITADCPLTDPAVVEAVVRRHLATHADFTSNVLPRSFPRGLDVEVVRARTLREAAARAADPAEREHVMPYVYRRPERFRLVNLLHGEPLGRERWTVDTADDIAFVRAAVAAAGADPAAAGWQEILAAVGRRATPRPGVLWLRPATLADADLLLALRNDADAVRYSTTGRPVEPAAHRRFVRRIVDDAGRRTWVGMIDDRPVGQVRVDVRGGVGTVAYAVAREHRGQGLGRALLATLHDELRADQQVTRLLAIVHPGNEPSRRALLAAGYAPDGSDAGGFLRYVCERSPASTSTTRSCSASVSAG